jgi:hypothetical protein
MFTSTIYWKRMWTHVKQIEAIVNIVSVTLADGRQTLVAVSYTL